MAQPQSFEVWVTAFGVLKVDALPALLQRRVAEAPRRKDGRFDMRYAECKKIAEALDNQVLQEYEAA